MRFATLLVAAAASAALWVQPATATEVLYSFTGSGEGVASDFQRQGIPYVQTFANGSLAFDPLAATSYGGGLVYNQTYQTAGGNVITYDIFASSIGDQLILSLTEDGRQTAGNYLNSFSLTANFTPGYLGGAFPTTIDFSKVLSSTYTAGSSFYSGHGGYLTSFGQLTSLTAQGTTATAPYGTAFVTTNGVPAVPEPGTWITMLLGLFGLAGLLRGSSRRRPLGSEQQHAALALTA